MIFRFKHVHSLETRYLIYGVKGQPGVIWTPRGQKGQITFHMVFTGLHQYEYNYVKINRFLKYCGHSY